MAPPLSPPDATPSTAVPLTPVAAPAVDDAWARRLVDGWVRLRLGLEPAPQPVDRGQPGDQDHPAGQAALAARWPDWEARAAALIAEGLLAYVALEMVAPDLAIAAAGHGHGPGHPRPAPADDELAAHLWDFVDYRDHLGQFDRRAAAPR